MVESKLAHYQTPANHIRHKKKAYSHYRTRVVRFQIREQFSAATLLTKKVQVFGKSISFQLQKVHPLFNNTYSKLTAVNT